ncbi:PA2779 family protein [Alloalcanivorax sp. C16-2]|uniref:PA2779 family protein n=1 Tax=Alloalcanivorax TaxID=3020832 RepID=UPI001934B068|nr:PA2779 family protein [Alloalcanivorax marinus]MBL7251314.1 PA2779 family protein [Alloalcanivorax marinus]
MKKSITGALTALVMLITQGLFVPAAQAAMVTTDGMVANEQRAAMEQKVMRFMERDAAAKVLAENGVTRDDVQQRLSRLSDSELQQLATKADQMPAGSGVVGVILAVILILVLLDLLGATDVFPVIDPIG